MLGDTGVAESVTTTLEVALTPPDSAVISEVPAPVAVASPEELIVATEGLLEVHRADFVISEVVGVAEPIWFVATAVNCTVCPIAVSCADPATGRTEIDCRVLQPARGSKNKHKSAEAERLGGIAISWPEPTNLRYSATIAL